MTLTKSGRELAEYFELATGTELLGLEGGPLKPRYNIAPSQDVAAILFEPGLGRHLEWMRWGLVPSWAKDPSIGARLFNARSETVATKPSFRSAFRHRRCLVAADGFYEWMPRNRGHQAFYFEPASDGLLALAGLFESWRGEGGEVIDSCTVLTTDANPDVKDVHHRMPVLLETAQRELWLDPEASPDDVEGLLRPPPRGTLRKRPVGRYVNDARQDDPRCLESDAPAEQAALFTLDGGDARDEESPSNRED